MTVCWRCGGAGVDPVVTGDCPACNGSGTAVRDTSHSRQTGEADEVPTIHPLPDDGA